MVILKLSGKLHDEIVADLSRPHSFALERVGFALSRTTRLDEEDRMVLLTRYLRIPDDQYLKDRHVGCRIGTNAITLGAHAAYNGRARGEGVFHVHIHGHTGMPRLSKTDFAEILEVIRGYRSIGRAASHGILLLSQDSASAWTWLPNGSDAIKIDRITVVDSPLRLIESR